MGRTILSALLVSLTLSVLTTVLTLPGGIGPNEFLSLGRLDIDLMNRVTHAWWDLIISGPQKQGFNLVMVATAFFVIDTGLFVPLYGWLLFDVVRRLAVSASAPGSRKIARFAAHAFGFAATALVVADLIENNSGLASLTSAGGRSYILGAGFVALVVNVGY